MAMREEFKDEEPLHEIDGIVENRVNPPPVYFSILFYGLILWGVVFAAYFLLSGWSSEGELQEKMAAHQERSAQTSGSGAPAAVAIKTEEERLAEGEHLFAQSCAMCHGADGTGGIGSNLTQQEFIYGRSDDAIRSSIQNGRQGGMPGFTHQLSADQIESLLRFVLRLQP
jgi:cytochrome c oxidase cbb3-type subunit 3